MGNTRKSIPKTLEAEVLAKSRRRCCICFAIDKDNAEKQGQIVHLDKDPANALADNLAFLCLPHHDRFDSQTSQSKGLTVSEVKHYRSLLWQAVITDSSHSRDYNGGSMSIASNSKAEPQQTR